MRVALVLGSLLVAAALCGAEAQKEKLKSGPQPGKGLAPFDVKDVTGPMKSAEKLCYVWRNGQIPVVLVFAREIDKGLTGLVKAIEEAQKGKKNVAAFLVLMDKDPKAGAEKLKKLAEETKCSFPLTLNYLGEKSPAGYDIDPKVKFTVLVYNKKTVVSNFALNEIKEGDTKTIVEAANKNMAAGLIGS